MNLITAPQLNPQVEELKQFFEDAFTELDDGAQFSEEQNQNLEDWFSIDEMTRYLSNGQLIETRLEDNTLVGSIFIGKQNPMTWPDGRKMEIFILGVAQNYRSLGIARELMARAEDFALSQNAQKIIVNTHISMESVHNFYLKLGYKKIGTLTEYYDNGDAVFFQKVL